MDNSRDHHIVVDLPVDYGGDNKGPTALEMAIMSFYGKDFFRKDPPSSRDYRRITKLIAIVNTYNSEYKYLR